MTKLIVKGAMPLSVDRDKAFRADDFSKVLKLITVVEYVVYVILQRIIPKPKLNLSPFRSEKLVRNNSIMPIENHCESYLVRINNSAKILGLVFREKIYPRKGEAS